MKLQELDGILEKMSELKVFFDFGQRTVPLLEEVIGFVQEVGPVIEGIKSLVDVTSQKLPKASEQLGKVNQFAERASNDILNTVDRMIANIESMQTPDHNRVGGDMVVQTAEKVGAVVDVLARKYGGDEDLVELLNVWDLHAQSLKARGNSNEIQSKLEHMRDDCTNIMMALQVQDITGQQIAAVIGLMQAVDDVLRRLISEVTDAIQLTRPLTQVEIAQPPEYVGVDERKRMVDSLLQKARSGDLQLEAGATLDKHIPNPVS